MTPYAEYLVVDDEAPERQDFIRGELWTRGAEDTAHAGVVAAVVRELGRRLTDRPGLVLATHSRVRNTLADFSCYPDASLVIEPLIRASDDPTAIANPVLVIEVLSDSTEAYDRGTKNFEYRAFPSVKEIVFISQKKQSIEVHRRNADGQFVIQDYGAGSTIEFASVGVKIAISELYRDLVQYRAQSGA